MPGDALRRAVVSPAGSAALLVPATPAAAATGRALVARNCRRCIAESSRGVRAQVSFVRRKRLACKSATKSRFTIRVKTLTNASLHKSIVGLPPLAPPEYRGGGHATILFIPPLYSGGARGGSWTTAVVSTNREKRFSFRVCSLSCSRHSQVAGCGVNSLRLQPIAAGRPRPGRARARAGAP